MGQKGFVNNRIALLLKYVMNLYLKKQINLKKLSIGLIDELILYINLIST